ncbi:hypothetical protein Hanom_Chr10g00873091 [Helianthus anomalus]
MKTMSNDTKNTKIEYKQINNNIHLLFFCGRSSCSCATSSRRSSNSWCTTTAASTNIDNKIFNVFLLCKFSKQTWPV